MRARVVPPTAPPWPVAPWRLATPLLVLLALAALLCTGGALAAGRRVRGCSTQRVSPAPGISPAG